MLRRAAELVAARRAGDRACWRSATRARRATTTTTPAALAALGIPAFACTPDLFPDLMAAAIQRQDLGLWAAKNDIVVARGDEG